MFIRRLSVTGFGCLDDVAWEFAPGGFLILGPNESGKTTLVRCIEALLFGYPPKESRPWRPWDAAEFAGELELGDEDGSLHISRSFADNRTTVIRRDREGNALDQPLGPVALPPGGTTHERTLYSSWLSAAIGLHSADLFARTLYVPQGSLEVEVGQIDALLRSYMTGGGLDVAAVSQALAERRRSVAKLPSEGRARVGELDRVRDELKGARAELAQAREREGRFEQLRTDLSDLQSKLDTQQTEHDRLAALLETADRAEQLRETAGRLEELVTRYRREQKQDAETQAKVAQLARQLEGEEDLVENAQAIRPSLDDWERAHDTVEVARERLAALTEAGEVGPHGVIAAAVGGVVGGVLGVLLAGWPGGLVGVVLGLVLGFALGWWLLVRRPRLAERSLRQRDLSAAEEDFRQAAEGLAQIVPRVPQEEFARLREHLDGLQLLARQKADLEAALLSDEAAQELATQLEARSAELEAVKKEQRDLDGALARAGLGEGTGIEDARHQWKVLADDLQAGSRRLQALREEAAELRGAQKRPAVVVAEEVEELEERERQLSDRFEGLRRAEEVWAEALGQFQGTYLERYAERVGAWLRELSGGGYGGVRMQPQADVPERRRSQAQARRVADGRWIPADRLSRGASDRLYLALRLALAEVMGEQGVAGPLILDDPFVTFDADRLADAFETLRRVAERRQVILLAHDERYRELGWPVIELPAGHGLRGTQSGGQARVGEG